jgi:hypothetical protein
MFIQLNRADFYLWTLTSPRKHKYSVKKGLIKSYIRPDQSMTSETLRSEPNRVKPVTFGSRKSFFQFSDKRFAISEEIFRGFPNSFHDI